MIVIIILLLVPSFKTMPVFDMIPSKRKQEERILLKTLVSSVINKEKALREKTEQLESLLSILNNPVSHEITNKFHGFWIYEETLSTIFIIHLLFKLVLNALKEIYLHFLHLQYFK